MIKPILAWPNPKLKVVSKDVEAADFGTDALKAVVQDMIDTMEAAGGLGLAAIQIGIPYRLFVSRGAKDVQAYINPVIMKFDGDKRKVSEGCLSIPGVYEDVERYEEIILSAFDVDGVESCFQFEGIEAQCAQHETEHLDGKLSIVDGLGPVKRDLIKRKVAKFVRQHSRR